MRKKAAAEIRKRKFDASNMRNGESRLLNPAAAPGSNARNVQAVLEYPDQVTGFAHPLARALSSEIGARKPYQESRGLSEFPEGSGLEGDVQMIPG